MAWQASLNGNTGRCMKLRKIADRISLFLLVCLLASGTAMIAPGSAEAGTGVDFGTGNAYVTFGVAPDLELPQFTIECWFKREGTGTTANSGSGGLTAIPLVTKGRGEADGSNKDMNYFLGIRSSDNVLAADFEDAATGLNHPITGVTPIVEGIWYHAAATYNGTKWQLFLNGGLEAELNVGATPRADSIQHAGLGAALNSTGIPEGHFDGVLDEIRIWNYARSLAEIQSTIDTEVTSAQAGLLARWGLNEGAGTAVNGSAGTSVNGTITGTGFNWVPGSPFEINFPPDPPALNTPLNGSTDVSTSPLLDVTVTDPEDNNLTVKFYGRPKPPAPESFTIIALPDTQNYSASLGGGTPAIFSAQTQWIVDNRAARKIAFAAHLGDIVNTGSSVAEWQNSETALSLLEPDGIPYGLAIGNHDQDPYGTAGGTANYNTYFGISRFSGRPYYGGHYGTTNDNHFELVSAAGIDFIFIFLEHDTTQDVPVLDWADNLLKSYSGRKGIVVSHYMTGTGNPAPFGAQGLAIYDALKDNPNLLLMLCGHSPGVGRRSDTFNGNVVHTLMSDYQNLTNGGDGYLRIMEFFVQEGDISEIQVKTYSPTKGLYRTSTDDQFTLSYAAPAAAFQLIGSVAPVESGTNATFDWPGLDALTEYEWYATVSDSANTTTGTIWSFHTIGAAGDFDGDCDVDGSDLAALIANPNLVDLYAFALRLGVTECP
jgi:hypothetical protein